MPHEIVLLRHSESEWNHANRFTGWTDVDLNAHGVAEAHRAGDRLRAEGFAFDVAFTSVLKRAIHTLWIVLDELDRAWIPVIRSWRLNERHYGALQGEHKRETAERLGRKQVKLWRSGFDVPPPPLDFDDPRHPRFDPRYARVDPALLPVGESLKDTLERVLPFWNAAIVPRIRAGERVLVVAHGNSLRALVMHLERLPPEQVPALKILNAVPRVYTLDDNLAVLERRDLLPPPPDTRAALERTDS